MIWSVISGEIWQVSRLGEKLGTLFEAYMKYAELVWYKLITMN